MMVWTALSTSTPHLTLGFSLSFLSISSFPFCFLTYTTTPPPVHHGVLYLSVATNRTLETGQIRPHGTSRARRFWKPAT
jgi:hypothetical protein